MQIFWACFLLLSGCKFEQILLQIQQGRQKARSCKNVAPSYLSRVGVTEIKQG